MEIRRYNPYTFIYIDGTGNTTNIEGSGRATNPQALAPDAVLGSLIAKIGKEGVPFQIFKQRVFLPGDAYKIKSSDEVYIAINDSDFRDNRGAHAISVRGENLCINCPEQNTKPTVTSSQVPVISGGVLNGKAISLPQPAYPAIAKSAHASGTVVVQVTIDEQGGVISAQPVSGHPLLHGAAVAAARSARFTPTKLSGRPVKVTGVIKYEFAAQ